MMRKIPENEDQFQLQRPSMAQSRRQNVVAYNYLIKRFDPRTVAAMLRRVPVSIES